MYLNDYKPVNDWRGVIIFTEKRFDPGLPIQYEDYSNSRGLSIEEIAEITGLEVEQVRQATNQQ